MNIPDSLMQCDFPKIPAEHESVYGLDRPGNVYLPQRIAAFKAVKMGQSGWKTDTLQCFAMPERMTSNAGDSIVQQDAFHRFASVESVIEYFRNRLRHSECLQRLASHERRRSDNIDSTVQRYIPEPFLKAESERVDASDGVRNGKIFLVLQTKDQSRHVL